MKREKIYYYTDFTTFKLILQNGTLRYKESTSSNDNLDTVQLYEELFSLAIERLDNNDLKAEQKFYFDMLKHNGARSSRVSLVACFTSKSDSRMLWDAYTMHRKDRKADRYNGVCIEFNKSILTERMNIAEPFDIKRCHEIIYGYDRINSYLQQYIDIYSSEVEELSKEQDQTQHIIPPIPVPFTDKVITLKKSIVYPTLRLTDRIDVAAPFFKHSFWSEECETRALLSVKVGNEAVKTLNRYEDGSIYYDLPISKECISKVILGPEFSEEDKAEVDSLNGAILFSDLLTENSQGTGVITNR